MKHRSLTIIPLLAFIVLTAGLTQAAEKPNIIFIMADDLGYADLGCYGQKDIRTPVLDNMAAEGVRFTQVYAGSTVCAPTRSVLMTGQHTGHTRVRGNGLVPLQPEDITVAQVLKQAGYTTGMVGKWGLGEPGSISVPSKKGWDFFFGFLNQVNAHFYYPETMWRNDQQIELPGNRDGQRGQYAHDLMTEEALGFVERNQDEPFFLYIPYTIPHSEMLVPEDSLTEYLGKFEDVPYKGNHYASTPTPNIACAAMVTRMDRDIGRLLDLLKDLNLDEKTIVFFTSDNGPAAAGGRDADFFNSNGPLRGIKRDLYDGGIRVPMIVRWPGQIAPGRTDDRVWAFWDVLPTLADLTDSQSPQGIDGISVLPTILGEDQQMPERYLYWEFHERGFSQAVRWKDWKAVRLQLDGPLELYNLADDIGETNNVAADHPEIVARIEKYLKTARTDSPDWVPKQRKAKKK